MTVFESVEVLTAKLKHGDADIRRELVKELGQIGSEKEVGLLVKVLFSEPLCEIRQLAAKSLKKIEGWVLETDRQMMIDGLKSEDWKTREACAFALGELGLKPAAGHLIKSLGDRDFTVHEAAANALKKIKNRKAKLFHDVFFCNKKERIPELRQYLKDVRRLLHSENIDVRKTATRAVGILQDSESTGTLISLLDSTDVDTCILSAETLGKIGDQKAVKPLERLSKEHCNVVVKVVARKALADIRESADISAKHKETVRRLESHSGRVCGAPVLRNLQQKKSKI